LNYADEGTIKRADFEFIKVRVKARRKDTSSDCREAVVCFQQSQERLNRNKAADPDGVGPRLLKT